MLIPLLWLFLGILFSKVYKPLEDENKEKTRKEEEFRRFNLLAVVPRAGRPLKLVHKIY